MYSVYIVKVTRKGVFCSVGITCHLFDKDCKKKLSMHRSSHALEFNNYHQNLRLAHSMVSAVIIIIIKTLFTHGILIRI